MSGWTWLRFPTSVHVHQHDGTNCSAHSGRFTMWGRSGYVTHNNPDYYNNIRDITWSQAWLRGHDGPGQICTHPGQQNIFSARWREHIVSCPVDAANLWKPNFPQTNLFYRTFYNLEVFAQEKKMIEDITHLSTSDNKAAIIVTHQIILP